MNKEKLDKIKALRKTIANFTDDQKKLIADQYKVTNLDGHVLSHYNTLLLFVQSQGNQPTIVGGFKQWLSAGKAVKKGEHGFIIFFPCGKKQQDKETDDNGNQIIEPEYFATGTVFDVSQVESVKDKELVTA